MSIGRFCLLRKRRDLRSATYWEEGRRGDGTHRLRHERFVDDLRNFSSPETRPWVVVRRIGSFVVSEVAVGALWVVRERIQAGKKVRANGISDEKRVAWSQEKRDDVGKVFTHS